MSRVNVSVTKKITVLDYQRAIDCAFNEGLKAGKEKSNLDAIEDFVDSHKGKYAKGKTAEPKMEVICDLLKYCRRRLESDSRRLKSEYYQLKRQLGDE